MVPSIGVRIPVPEHLKNLNMPISLQNKNLKTRVYKEGKYYTAESLTIEVSSFGKTKEEALANLQQAIDLKLENSN